MLKEVLIFTGGAIFGAAGTYLIINKRYEKITRQEIDDVKALYLSKCRKLDTINKMNEEKERFSEIISNNGYSDQVNENDKELEENSDEDEDDPEGQWEREREAPVEHPDEPYTITPHQFVYENRHYDKITLLYYPYEQILVNEVDGIEEDINVAIGEDSLNKFGEFEPDVAYIRNDRLGIDYEVILQPESERYNIEDDQY